MTRHDAAAAEVAGAFPEGWIVVLTAAERRGLDDDDIHTAMRASGCERAPSRRLGAAAAEFACPAGGVAAAAEWETILPGVDVNCVPAGGRRKRILIADMDSTIIGAECIDEIADFAGVKDRVAAITARAMAGEIGFEGALTERVALLEGLGEDVLERVMADRIHLTRGARALVRTMTAAGAATALVSGGFTWFTGRVAAAAGFGEHRANRLEIADGRLTGRAIPPILGRDAKRAALDDLAARIGADPGSALALGDGANDAAMVAAAGLGVGYRPKAALADVADAVIRHADLTAVLHLQGWHADEMVLD